MQTRTKGIALTLLVGALGATIAWAETPMKDAASVALPSVAAGSAALQIVVDDYFDRYYFPENPTDATLSGIHLYDSKLEDYSAAGERRQIAALHGFEARLASIDPRDLDEWHAGDRSMLLSRVRSELLTLEKIRPLHTQPDVYSTIITESAFSLMERQFDTPTERLKRVIDRERLMPAVLAQARLNLVNPPRIHTQVAVDQLPGVIDYFRTDLPGAFARVDDPQVLKDFAASNAAVISALQDYLTWLKKNVLPRSKGDFRLGADTYRRKLLYDEMVETPLPDLLKIGMADLRHNQAEFAKVAHEFDPSKTPQQVLAELAADHSAPGALLDEFRSTLDGLARFIRDHRIIDLPAGQKPTLEETPPYMRATTFASMDTPGPFETRATEAYFNVTLPDSSLTPAQVEEFMAQFNHAVVRTTAIHEAYPGHYVQFLWMHQVDDRVRKLIDSNTNSEGWAHYCEQMILDEGYNAPGVGAANRRESLLMRLGQIQDALLRDARFIVGVRMHTGSMSFDQGVQFFVHEGYQSRSVGVVETTRGASDPTYLYYTLGKLQILKLRADLKAKQGAEFDLGEFHDAFMKQGLAPLKIIRKALLGDDSPAL